MRDDVMVYLYPTIYGGYKHYKLVYLDSKLNMNWQASRKIKQLAFFVVFQLNIEI